MPRTQTPQGADTGRVAPLYLCFFVQHETCQAIVLVNFWTWTPQIILLDKFDEVFICAI